jgi:carotenoid cleavage dioxygenase-like enzyme
LKLLDGEWPVDLSGHVFLTSPDIATGVPLFGSDGMIYRLDLTPRGVMVRSESTRTPSSHAAEAVLKRRMHLSTHRFRQVGLSRLSLMLGAVECLNVAPTPVGDRMWVTSDAGRPWELDPATLKLLGPVGGRDVWRGVAPAPWVFPLTLTSGHPAIDPDGTAWEVNFSQTDAPGAPMFLDLLRINGAAIDKWGVVDAETGKPVLIHQSVHQMACTERHIILLDSAFKVEEKQLVVEALRSVFPLPERLLAGMITDAQSDESVFWIIDRERLGEPGTPVPARRVVIDTEATHFAADWLAPEGVIRVVVLHTPCQDVSEWIRSGEKMVDGTVAHPDLVGMPAAIPMEQGSVGLHTLHPDGKVRSQLLQSDPHTWGPALFTLPPGNLDHIRQLWYYTSGVKSDALPARMVDAYASRVKSAKLAAALREGRPNCLVHVDLDRQRFDGWPCPPGWGIFGLCYVPREGGADAWDGYLIACALSDRHEGLPDDSTGDEIWVFRASDVGAGPIARLGHPEMNMPFTLHTAWLPRLMSLPPLHHVDLERDTDPEVAIAQWEATFPMPAMLKRTVGCMVRKGMKVDDVRAMLAEDVLPLFPRRR